MVYDAAGNDILNIHKDRFHDTSATGELGDPGAGTRARVSFVAAYYDLADRLTDTVDVGTNDTPLSREWSPDNNTGTANMVQVAAFVYDNGGVGDSNLTQMTLFPGNGAEPRVTQFFVDWRDRTVASKSGVQAVEATDLNRPIFYTEFDNLGQAIAQEQYGKRKGTRLIYK